MKEQEPIYLFSGFLSKKAKAKNSIDNALAFAIKIGVHVPIYEVDKAFWFDDYFPGGFIIDETITFKVSYANNKLSSIKYGINSEDGMGIAERLPEVKKLDDGSLEININFGFKKEDKNPPKPGFRGCLILISSDWNK